MEKVAKNKEKGVSESFFSISFDLILLCEPLPYDLYINLSLVEKSEKYIRIFPNGEVLERDDLTRFQEKFKRLYVHESDRNAYLKSLCKISGKNEVEKAEVLKDSAIKYLGKIFDQKREFSAHVFNDALEGCKDVVVGLVDTLQGYNIDQIQELIGDLSFHDFYTYDHSINVSMYCILLFRLMEPHTEQIEVINAGFGGLLHDIGKIKIPTQIINKPGKLSTEEFDEIKKHPDYGFSILESAGIKVPEGIDIHFLSKIVLEHHENYDGTGYPKGLNHTQIHQCAKVAAIADFFDAITTKRSYHEALSIPDALALMKKSEGKKIDPDIFNLLIENTNQFDRNRGSKLELVKDFDPCQPTQNPPWEDHSKSAVLEGKTEDDFGKIIVKTEKIKKKAS